MENGHLKNALGQDSNHAMRHTNIIVFLLCHSREERGQYMKRRKHNACKQWSYIAGIALLILLSFTAKSNRPAAANYATINGTFKINTNVKNGMVLDIAGGSGNNCTNIQIYQSNQSGAQQFSITHVKSGWHKISHIKSGKVLDVAGGIQKNNTNVQLYKDNGRQPHCGVL